MPYFFNPNQPRVPKGQSHGGEWTRDARAPHALTDFSARNRPPVALGQSVRAKQPIVRPGQPLVPGQPILPWFPAPNPDDESSRQNVERELLDRVDQSLKSFAGKIGALLHGFSEDYRKQQIEWALIEFDRLSEGNTKDSNAILQLKARKYDKGEEKIWHYDHIDLATESEVKDSCRRLAKVQKLTDLGAAKAREKGLRGAEFGNSVHKYVDEEIKALKKPDLKSELSFVPVDGADQAKDATSNAEASDPGRRRIEIPKTREEEKKNAPGSIRADVVETVDESTVCLYDIKTGGSRLDFGRMLKIMRHAAGTHRNARRFFVIQVKPSPQPLDYGTAP